MMMRLTFRWQLVLIIVLSCVPRNAAAAEDERERAASVTNHTPRAYVLGPGDEVNIWARDAEEISAKPAQLDVDGSISLPMLGRLQAGGKTVAQFEEQLVRALQKFVLEPVVAVNVTRFRSQPVSVMGAVNQPGVHQLEGQKTLAELLALAGGVKADAGNAVIITRSSEIGPLPLPGSRLDSTGRFSVGSIDLKTLTSGSDPALNIVVRQNDVISVPFAELIYVIGEVNKSGGFVLTGRGSVSVLQALAMAEGLKITASRKHAKLLRPRQGMAERVEIAVNLTRILEGKASDLQLQPNDILFVPNSAAKSATVRAIETALQIGTGIVIWRR